MYCQASNRKVAKPWLDSRYGSASLYPSERHLMLFPSLGPSSPKLSILTVKYDKPYAISIHLQLFTYMNLSFYTPNHTNRNRVQIRSPPPPENSNPESEKCSRTSDPCPSLLLTRTATVKGHPWTSKKFYYSEVHGSSVLSKS